MHADRRGLGEMRQEEEDRALYSPRNGPDSNSEDAKALVANLPGKEMKQLYRVVGTSGKRT